MKSIFKVLSLFLFVFVSLFCGAENIFHSNIITSDSRQIISCSDSGTILNTDSSDVYYFVRSNAERELSVNKGDDFFSFSNSFAGSIFYLFIENNFPEISRDIYLNTIKNKTASLYDYSIYTRAP